MGRHPARVEQFLLVITIIYKYIAVTAYKVYSVISPILQIKQRD